MAAHAHLATFGETQTCLINAAAKFSDNNFFTKPITWKQVQDRFNRSQGQYESHEKVNHRLSGVSGGEMMELTDPLMTMKEARDDMANKKDAIRVEEKWREEEKKRSGASAISAATLRRETKDDINGEYLGDECEVASNQSSLKKGKINNFVGEIKTEMKMFGEHLKKVHLARIKIYKVV